MKTFLSIILQTLVFTVSAQTYLDTSCVWKEWSGGGGAGNPYFATQHYTITLAGDTTINGVLYHKTLMSGVDTLRNWVEDTIMSITPIYEYLAPIREENQVFYYHKRSTNSEVVLHNFNLNIGDTAVYDCDRPQVVTHIDTIYVGGIPRRHFHFSTSGVETSSLIEGIGSSEGLFTRPCHGLIFFEAFSELRCFSQGGEHFQMDPQVSCDPLVLATDDTTLPGLAIAPNPFDEAFDIAFPFSAIRDIRITVIDMMGAIVFDQYVGHPGITERVSLHDEIAGMYIVSVQSKDFRIAYKVVKR